jgi:general secretion pathway protein C
LPDECADHDVVRIDPDQAETITGIHRISDTEFELEPEAVDALLDPETVALVRIVPEVAGAPARIVGFRIFGIRPHMPLGQLGLQNGDRVDVLDDVALTSERRWRKVVAKLAQAESLAVQVNRRGKRLTLRYRIRRE